MLFWRDFDESLMIIQTFNVDQQNDENFLPMFHLQFSNRAEWKSDDDDVEKNDKNK